MTYIINPIWFYFLDVVGELNIFSAAACVVCLLLIIGSVVGYAICFDCDLSTAIVKKLFKTCLIALPITLVISVLIPSKETLITMMVAKFATYENAAWTLDTVKAAVDYIINAIGSL